MVNPEDYTVVIPARGGSKGIPRKNIQEFCGKPLIFWSIQQAKQAGCERIYVSTDDDEIANLSRSFGAEIVSRPKELSGDRATSEVAILHALETIGVADDEVVCFLQATSPVREGVDISRCVAAVHSGQWDSVFSGIRIDDLTLWSSSQDNFQPIALQEAGERLARQERNPIWVENGSIYAFRAKGFRESGDRLHGKVLALPVPKWTFHELDDLEDWNIAETLMRRFVLEEEVS